jgi:hypothetical protein
MRPTLRKIFVILAFALSFAVMHQESVSAIQISCSPASLSACYCDGQFYKCVADVTRCVCP